ncbi:condensation domain-containing protein [Salinispora arenicola]|uniref:condensation domain-containing protein n=1 Tax=Salinispora arenicola TaxID=168697 RepID=UPI001E4A2F98|nr:condensation domain-containing protein [Salinispora arenicola]
MRIYPTIAGRVTTEKRSLAVRRSKEIDATNRYPLTSRQKDPQHTERSPRHVIRLALRVRGEVRLDALQGALDDVVARHESLRTRINYSETDGSLGFQEVLSPLPVPLTVHDIPVTPGRSRDELAVDQYVKLHDELLSFTAVPSLRAALHRFDDRDAVLTLITHHLFGDNWSAGILRRELSACYKARISGTPHALPIPVQYREFVTWEQEFLQSDKAAKARNFWTEKLAGAEMYTMPADRPHGPDTLTPRSAVSNFLIDARDFAKVIASARQNRCTPWHLLVAASMVLAERIRGSSNITLLTVDNGRQVRDFHNTIGFFANLVPIRLDFGNCRSFRDLMLVARKASMDAHQHQIPFGTVLELAPELMRSFEDSQVAPIAFNYARASVTLSDIQFADRVESVPWPEDLPTMFHRGSCMWSLVLLPSGAFRCVIEYEPDMLDADTVERWGSDFVSLVLEIADRPDGSWKTQ